jgi:hypothetical protein
MLRLDVVECICRITAAMAGAEYGYLVGVLLHPFECNMFRAGYARSGRTGTLYAAGGRHGKLMEDTGPIVVILQLCFWIVDVLDYG